MNSVDDLLKNPFSSRPLQQKLEVIALGRPMPNLELSKTVFSSRTYLRFFKPKLYTEVSWLCGCPVRNAMFCFPCLLFNGDSIWATKGFTDLCHLKEKIRKHQESKLHLLNVLSLVNVRGDNIGTQLVPSYHFSIQKYNSMIESNRAVLSKYIDCISFCVTHGLPLSSQNIGDASKTPRVLRGLMDFVADLDINIRNHLESSCIFRDSSGTVQKLLDCILNVCREEIMNEIKTTHSISIVVDSVTDFSGKMQMALIIRYVNGSRICERFWGFLYPKCFDCAGISKCLLEELQLLVGQNKRLISQSYNGPAFMCGEKNSVQAAISKAYPDAQYVHSYMHTLSDIVRDCAAKKRGVGLLFYVLENVVTFFSSSKHMAALQEKERETNLGTYPVKWDFETSALNLVHDHHKILIQCLEKLEDDSSVLAAQQAHVLGINLRDSDFIFWLEFFYRVMPHVDILFQLVQSQGVTSYKVKEAVQFFVQVVQKLKGDLDAFLPTNESEDLIVAKRARYEDTNLADAAEVIDIITYQIIERFQFLEYHDITRIFDCRYFRVHVTEEDLNAVSKIYPSVNQRLMNELSVLCERAEFQSVKGTIPLLNFIVHNKIQDTFSEVTTVLQIILTMPGLTTEAERCFSTSKTIRKCLKTPNCDMQLNACGMLSVEKDLIKNIKCFNSRVIEKFASLEGCGKEFIFKK